MNQDTFVIILSPYIATKPLHWECIHVQVFVVWLDGHGNTSDIWLQKRRACSHQKMKGDFQSCYESAFKNRILNTNSKAPQSSWPKIPLVSAAHPKVGLWQEEPKGSCQGLWGICVMQGDRNPVLELKWRMSRAARWRYPERKAAKGRVRSDSRK